MTATRDPAAAELLPHRRLRRGAVSFSVLTVAGLVALFALGAPGGALPQLSELRSGFLLLALASALVDVVLGAWRFQIFIRRIHPRSPLWLPIRADLAGRFIAAVTPSQTGGGPAQVLVLHRGGIPVPESLAFLLINLISTLAFFLLAGGFAAWRFRGQFPDGVMRLLIQYGFAVVATLLGLLLVALFRPDLVARPLEWLARRSAGGDSRLATAVRRAAGMLVDSLEQYRAACRHFVSERPWLPAASFAVTILIYLNKFGLAWLVMRGLGVERDFATTLALVALAYCSTFLAPSPGSSGIAEVATGAFMSILLPAPLLGPFTLVYRMLIVYLPAAAGAIVLLAELRPERGRGPVPLTAARGAVVSTSANRPAWPWRVPMGLVLALSLAAAAAAADSETACPLCGRGAPATLPLLRAELETAADALAARNRRELGRIGSLLREGRLGPPESREARASAQLLARLALANWYSFLLPFVADPQRVRTVRPEAIAPLASRYCEAVAIPMPRLRELRLGRGHVCARYDLGGTAEEGSTLLGGRALRYRVREMEVGGRVRRVLGLDWGSAGTGTVEALVAEHYGFRLSTTRLTQDDGSRLDLFLALDVSGGWVRRFGVHRPAAFAFWATRASDAAPYVPRAPLVGSAIYLPGLRLYLPLLPDIECNDVRLLALPMPFLEAEELRRGALPAWLSSGGDLTLVAWKGEGPVPPGLRAYFPNR
jgi:uncharacterized protein (TIRG00374 family)